MGLKKRVREKVQEISLGKLNKDKPCLCTDDKRLMFASTDLGFVD